MDIASILSTLHHMAEENARERVIIRVLRPNPQWAICPDRRFHALVAQRGIQRPAITSRPKAALRTEVEKQGNLALLTLFLYSLS
jgi:hypothetical protein